jgi:Ca2+/Na+ antiporter
MKLRNKKISAGLIMLHHKHHQVIALCVLLSALMYIIAQLYTVELSWIDFCVSITFLAIVLYVVYNNYDQKRKRETHEPFVESEVIEEEEEGGGALFGNLMKLPDYIDNQIVKTIKRYGDSMASGRIESESKPKPSLAEEADNHMPMLHFAWLDKLRKEKPAAFKTLVDFHSEQEDEENETIIGTNVRLFFGRITPDTARTQIQAALIANGRIDETNPLPLPITELRYDM